LTYYKGWAEYKPTIVQDYSGLEACGDISFQVTYQNKDPSSTGIQKTEVTGDLGKYVAVGIFRDTCDWTEEELTYQLVLTQNYVSGEDKWGLTIKTETFKVKYTEDPECLTTSFSFDQTLAAHTIDFSFNSEQENSAY
jgi:hypothetical protein